MKTQKTGLPITNSALRQPLTSIEQVNYFTTPIPPPVVHMGDEHANRTIQHDVPLDINNHRNEKISYYYRPTSSPSTGSTGFLNAAILPCVAGVAVGLIAAACCT